MVAQCSHPRLIRALICATGLGNLQGRCIVNAICLMVGEEEFLQLAKDWSILWS